MPRFIEFMDVGSSSGWETGAVAPSADIVQRIGEEFPLEVIAPTYSGETSNRWRDLDGTAASMNGCRR